ncbi:ABC transporter ATP-binding protein [Natrarchaeobius oligotrophus]|nr:ABC transporter ATP-binding protein [Natrarchaeobius chitinivorans]
MSDTLLDVRNLTVKYKTSNGMLTAVSNASFTVEEGQFLGLVGESGCGKSTLVKTIMGALDNNGKITDGKIYFQGNKIIDANNELTNEKGKWTDISWIPQAAMNSLDPIERINKQAYTIAKAHTDLSQTQVDEKLKEMFDIVGIPKNRITDYPHQFSGGMKQRTLIALSLFLEPSLLIADEPTTGLDVIMQDQVINYLEEIQDELNLSVLIITHDISVVFEMCDWIAVMHSGQLVEEGHIERVYDQTSHPYSILLQESLPDLRHPDQELKVIEGDPPQNIGRMNYCSFANRCPWEIEECTAVSPSLETVSSNVEEDDEQHDHNVACIRKDTVRSEIHGGER